MKQITLPVDEEKFINAPHPRFSRERSFGVHVRRGGLPFLSQPAWWLGRVMARKESLINNSLTSSSQTAEDPSRRVCPLVPRRLPSNVGYRRNLTCR